MLLINSYCPKKKSPEDDTYIPPTTAEGVLLCVTSTKILSAVTFNKSIDPDLTKKSAFGSTFTDAVIDPVAI
jgi:hypothetical protein